MERFSTNRNQTKEEFLSQFKDTSEVITVKIRWAWRKGCSRFDTIGKESLIHIHYMQPWAATEDMPFGLGGTVYWLGKRKPVGFPYLPRFQVDGCYRLRVRQCKSGERFFLLEDIVATGIDISEDGALYDKACRRFTDLLSDEKKEVMIYCANGTDVSKAKRTAGMAIGFSYVDYSAIIEDDGAPKMVGRLITIPFDDKRFADNRKLKFKAGHIYKIRVIPYKNSAVSLALDEVIDHDAANSELEAAGKESLKPAKWTVEGFGDFDIHWDKIQMKASCEAVGWKLYTGKECEVSVYLECDDDNCHTAYESTKRFLDLYNDKESFEKKIFDAVADEMSDDDGMVETWSDEAGTISKDEMKNRLGLSVLSFEKNGIDIMLELDELFTDHAYSLYMDYDGNIKINGLWG